MNSTRRRKLATTSSNNWCIPGTVRTEAAVQSGSSNECDATLIGNRFMVTTQQCSHWTEHGVASTRFTPKHDENQQMALETKFIGRTYYYANNKNDSPPTITDFQYAILDLDEKHPTISCDEKENQNHHQCSATSTSNNNNAAALCSDDHQIVVAVPPSMSYNAATCYEIQQAALDGSFEASCGNNDDFIMEKVVESICHCEAVMDLDIQPMVPPPPPAMQQIPPPMPSSLYYTVAPTTLNPRKSLSPQQQLNASSGMNSVMPMGALAGLIVTSVLLLFLLGFGFYYFIMKPEQQQRAGAGAGNYNNSTTFFSSLCLRRKRNDAIAAVEVDVREKGSDESGTDTTTDLKKDEEHSII